jgi:hypothetical protein
MVHHIPDKQNPRESSSLHRIKMVSVSELLGSSDNEHSDDDFCRFHRM